MYYLWTRLEQFKERKKIKLYIIVRIELSINENTEEHQTYCLIFWTCLKDAA